jgi:hypothetical protein
MLWTRHHGDLTNDPADTNEAEISHHVGGSDTKLLVIHVSEEDSVGQPIEIESRVDCRVDVAQTYL